MAAERGRARSLQAAAVVGAGYAAILIALAPPAIVGPDDHGYYLQGSLLAQESTLSFQLESPVEFVGQNWLARADGRYLSRYSPGMGTLIAAAQRVAGVEASYHLSILLAAAGAAATLLLAARWMGVAWGLVAAALLVLSPVYTGQALLGAANIGAMAALAWGALLLLSWIDRGGIARATAAGLLLGFVPLIRIPEMIVGAPIAVLVLGHAWRHAPARRELLPMLTAAAVPIVVLATYHRVQYGAVTRSAYAVAGEQSGFAWSYLGHHLVHYAGQMWTGGLGVLPVLSLAGLIVAWRHPAWRRTALFLAAVTTSVVLLYSLHDHLPNPIPSAGARHLLPVFPFLVVLALVPLWRVGQGRGAAAGAGLAAGVVVLQAALLGPALWTEASRIIGARRTQHQVAATVQRHLAPGDVVWASADIARNLDPYRRWRLAQRDLTTIRLGRRHDPRRELTMWWERRARFEGLDVAARDSAFLAELRSWGAGAAVYRWVPGESLARPSSIWTCPAQFARVDSLRLGGGWRSTNRIPASEIDSLHHQPPGTTGSAEGCPPTPPWQPDQLYLLRLISPTR